MGKLTALALPGVDRLEVLGRRPSLPDGLRIYAIGDIAYMETPLYPNGHPQLANVAINQGKNLAKNLKLKLQKKELKEFEC